MDINKFQFITVDEKSANIKYEGVDKKGPRPYLVVRTAIKQGYFLAVPLVDKFDERGDIKRKGFY